MSPWFASTPECTQIRDQVRILVTLRDGGFFSQLANLGDMYQPGGDTAGGTMADLQNTVTSLNKAFGALGDPAEASTMVALDFLAGRSCSPIASGGVTAQGGVDRLQLLQPRNPTAAQRDNPALF